LEAVRGGDIGVTCREDVGIQERLAQPDEGVSESTGLDDGLKPELVHVAPEEGLDECDDPGLHLASWVSEHPDRQRRFVVEQPVQRNRLGHEGVDLSAGPGGVKRTLWPLGLPPPLRQQKCPLGDAPQCFAEQFFACAGVAEQRRPRHAELVGQGLHLQAAALSHPGRRQRHGAHAQWRKGISHAAPARRTVEEAGM